MSKKLSDQANEVKHEFPTMSDKELQNVDLLIKQKINDYNVTDAFGDISVYIEEQLSKRVESKNSKKIRKKSRKLTKVYLENERVFKLQEGWYCVLAYLLTIANMIQRVININTKMNDIISLGLYLGAMIIWSVIVGTKNLMGEAIEGVIDQFNSASAFMTIISLAIFYLTVILTTNTYIWIGVIVASVALIVYLTYAGRKRRKKYLREKGISSK